MTDSKVSLTNNLGTFEGYNFREQAPIMYTLTAEDVANWDHDADGEAEFWASGDNPAVRLVFKGQGSVTAQELVALDNLIDEVSSIYTVEETLIRVFYAVRYLGESIFDLDGSIEDIELHMYKGCRLGSVRDEAAWDLFETYWPEAYELYERDRPDGLEFDVDRFLDSLQWETIEVQLKENEYILLVREQ